MSVNMSQVLQVCASNAEQLRYLLNSIQEHPSQRIAPSVDYLAAKHNYNPPQLPQLDDLVRLIQSAENMNQQLVNENRFLKEEMAQVKNQAVKVVQENTQLHNELKNVTVHEILAEFQNQQINQGNNEAETKLKIKTEELHQSQLLINDLQKKLNLAVNNTVVLPNDQKKEKSAKNHHDDPLSFAIDNTLCSKCAGINDFIAKNEEIDRQKRDIDQLNKSVSFLKNKIDEIKFNESELHLQIKKYADLVKHLELEKEQAVFEKDQYLNEKVSMKNKMDELIIECDKKITDERRELENEIDLQKKQFMDQIENIEKIASKNEALIDRLTREKVTLSNELEDFKNKYSAVDMNSHQVTESLRNQYREVLKERDLLLHDIKRLRHDYDLYVQRNDQDKFCLRDELNSTRNRLLNAENDLLSTKEQCIRLTDENNKLQAEIISCKHAKETLENSRDKNLKTESEKYKKREAELTSAVVKLQNLHCIKVKELQDLVDMQQGLLDKLRTECRNLTQHIEESDSKYGETISNLNVQVEAYKIKCHKYEERARDFEDENIKHTHLHERMKERLQELTQKTHEQHEQLQKLNTSEHKLKLTNQQLIQDLSSVRQQLAIYSMPSKMKMVTKKNDLTDVQNIKTDNELNMLLSKLQN